MKFRKKLQNQVDNSIPEWKPKFLDYKLLKKQMKHLGRAAPISFLAAMFEEDQSIEDGILIPVTVDELSGGEEREEVGQKSKAHSKSGYRVQKKRKVEDAASEEFPEAQEPIMVQEQCDLIFKVNEETSVSAGEQETSPRRLTEKDENFLRLVKAEVHKFNAFFLEKEEEFLIRLSILEERTGAVLGKRVATGGVCGRSTYEDLIKVHKVIVRLHGEMVLLMNYSSLNYVGLLKILKKYDKHSKSSLRQLVHGTVLQQPFLSISNLKEMIARSLACADSIQCVFPTPENVVEPLGSGLARDVASNDVSQSDPLPRQIHALQEIK